MLNNYDGISRSFTFGSFYYKGITLGGQCRNWTSFYSNEILLPLTSLFYSQLTVSFVIENYEIEGAMTNVTETCSNSESIATIIDGLRAGRTTETNCNGVTWRVFQCYGAYTVLCANCKLNCVKTVSCPGTSYIINPCGTGCTGRLAVSSIINVQYNTSSYYPLLSAINATANSPGSIQVTFSMSSRGVVYCSAFTAASSTVLVSVMPIRMTGKRLLMNSSGIVNMTLSELDPETNYTVYCFSEDFSNNVMPFDVAIRNKASVSTACCRQLVVVNCPSSVPQYSASSSSLEPLFQIALNAAPTGKTSIRLIVSPCSSSSSIGDVGVYPSSFVFYPNSTSLGMSFVVRGTTVGCYAVQAVSSGSTYYIPLNISFVLRNIRSAPPAPNLLSAIYSNDGSALYFSFDVSTDRGASVLPDYTTFFNCSRLTNFRFVGASRCAWQNATCLMAILPSNGFIPAVGSNATVLGNTIRTQCSSTTSSASCSSYSYMTASSLAIVAPSNVVFPVASLLCPLWVNPCDGFYIDPTLSTGFAGQPWASMTWGVNGSLSLDSLFTLQSYLATTYPDTTVPVYIPSTYLSYGVLNITLQLKNAFGLTGASVCTIKVQPSFRPYVMIHGTSLWWIRTKPIDVTATAIFPSCASNSSNAITFVWRIYKGTSYISMSSTSKQDSRLSIPAYSLDAGYNYSLTVEVFMTPRMTTLSTVATSTLFLARQGVNASIIGGPSRTVLSSVEFVLDASHSLDIDYPDNSALSYTWSCMQVGVSYGLICDIDPSNSATWVIPANSLLSEIYQFSVTVRAADGSFATAKQVVTVVEGLAPVVSFSSPFVRYNTNGILTLTGSISYASEPSYVEWRSDGSVNLSALAVSPRSGVFDSSAFSFSFQLLDSSFVPGASYVFTLASAFVNSSIYTTAEITVMVNAAPRGGAVAVSPNQGVALTTIFLCSTSSWNDDPADYPLHYSLSYFAVDRTMLRTIKGKDAMPYTNSYLGQGALSTNYVVTIIATAFDVWDGSANASTTAVVKPIQGKSFAVMLSTNLLTDALRQQNATAYAQAVNSALPSVNSVDCTVSVACALLNRTNCYATARTCGSCLAGYLGITGDSNIPCTKGRSPIGSQCSTNASCISLVCKNGVCADSMKKCPNGCSNHGSCQYFDYLENNLTSCGSLQDCSARCVCNVGYYGEDCSLTATVLSQLSTYREAFCNSLLESPTFQDFTNDVLYNRAVLVGQVLQDPTQISNTTLSHCVYSLTSIVSRYPSFYCQGNGLSVVISAFNNVLQAKNYLNTELLTNITSTLLMLSNGCVNSYVLGGFSSASLRNGNIRFKNMLTLGKEISGVTWDLARSDYEVYNGVATAQITALVPTSLMLDQFAITAVEYTNNPGKQATNSAHVVLGVNTIADRDATRRRLESANNSLSFLITLLNYLPVVYSRLDVTSFIVDCPFLRSTNYTLNVSCPEETTVAVDCPAFRKGRVNVTCPGYEMVPRCVLWTGSAYGADSLCSVLSYNAYNTTCVCTVKATAESSRRRLSDNAFDVNAIDLSTVTEVLSSSLVMTFIAAPSDLDVNSSVAVVSAMSAVFGLMCLGWLLIWRKQASPDKKYRKKLDQFALSKTQTVETYYRTIQGFFDSIYPGGGKDDSTPWYLHFALQLRKRHAFAVLVTGENDSLPTLFKGWFQVFAKILTIVFETSWLVRVFFPDDDRCSHHTRESDCLEPRVAQSSLHACEWVEENFSCIYHRPEVSLPLVVILCFVVTGLAAVQLQLFSAVVHLILWCKKALSSSSAVLPTLRSEDEAAVQKADMISFFTPKPTDEFMAWQTLRSTFSKAARLSKQFAEMDDILPQEECDILLKVMQAAQRRWQTDNAFRPYRNRMTIERLWYGFLPFEVKPVLRMIERSREESILLLQRLETETSLAEEREQALIKHYLLYSLLGYQRNIAQMKFSELDEERKEGSHGAVYQQHFTTFFLLCTAYMMAVAAGGAYLGMNIGNRSVELWLVVLFVSLVEEFFAHELFVIFCDALVLKRWMAADFYRILLALNRRSRLLLARTGGAVRNALDLVQHFNPACRVARKIPHLPIARLLLSLNDIDLPLRRPVDWPIVHSLHSLSLEIVFGFTYFSSAFQIVYLSVLSAAVVNGLAWALYELGKESTAAGVVVAVVFLGSMITPLVYHIGVDSRKRRAQEMEKNLAVFSDLDVNIEAVVLSKPSAPHTFFDTKQLATASSGGDHSFRKSLAPRPVSAVTGVKMEAFHSLVEEKEDGFPNPPPPDRHYLHSVNPPSHSVDDWRLLGSPLPVVQGPPLPYSEVRISGPPLQATIDPDFYPHAIGLRPLFGDDEDEGIRYEEVLIHRSDRPEVFSCQRRIRRIQQQQQRQQFSYSSHDYLGPYEADQSYYQLRHHLNDFVDDKDEDSGQSPSAAMRVNSSPTLSQRRRRSVKEKVFESTLRQRMARRRFGESESEAPDEVIAPGDRARQLEAGFPSPNNHQSRKHQMISSQVGVEDELLLFGNLFEEGENEARHDPDRGPGAILAAERAPHKRRKNFPMYLP